MSLAQEEGKRPDSQTREPSDSELLDVGSESGSAHVEGDCPYDNDGELDYDELMEGDNPTTSAPGGPQAKGEEDDDEVEVHATDVIEEGEMSSDEEGEIKETDDESNDATTSQPPQVSVDSSLSKPSPAVPEEQEKSGGDLEEEKSENKSSRVKETVISLKDAKSRKHRKEEDEEKRSRDSDSDSDGRESHSRRRQQKYLSSSGSRESGPPALHSSGSLADKIPTICRHFLNGKCSWGDSCRFKHEDPFKERSKLPPRDRLGMGPQFPGGGPPMMPPHGGGGGPPFMGGPPHGPSPRFPPHPGPHPPHGFIPGHPLDGPPRMGPPGVPMGHIPRFGPHGGGPGGPPFHPPLDRHPHDMPPYPQFGNGPNASEIAEESDGWVRLRTVTSWSSDEEKEDLRKKLMKRKKGAGMSDEEGEGDSETEHKRKRLYKGAAEEWTDPWARTSREKSKSKKKKTKEEVPQESSGESSSSSDEMKATKSKKKSKREKQKSSKKQVPQTPPSPKSPLEEGSSSEEEVGSSVETPTKKRKKNGQKRKPLSKPPKRSREDSDGDGIGADQYGSPGEELSDRESIKKHKSSRRSSSGKKKRSKHASELVEEEIKKKRKSSKKSKKRQSSSSPEDPRHLREEYYPPHHHHPFPPPDDHERWPMHGRPRPPHPHHHSMGPPHFVDEPFPPPHPHRHHHHHSPPFPPHHHRPPSPPQTDRFGRDISKRMEYEEMRMRRDRLPPGKGPMYMSRDVEYVRGRPHTPPDDPRSLGPGPHGWGEPLHRRGFPHHEGRPPWRDEYAEREMVGRRGSSEELSRSVTPGADYQSSSSESSVEVHKSRSKSGGRSSSRHEMRRKEKERRKEESSRHGRSRERSDHITQSLSRKEKLLQELQALNRVIEKKKSKKHSR